MRQLCSALLVLPRASCSLSTGLISFMFSHTRPAATCRSKRRQSLPFRLLLQRVFQPIRSHKSSSSQHIAGGCRGMPDSESTRWHSRLTPDIRHSRYPGMDGVELQAGRWYRLDVKIGRSCHRKRALRVSCAATQTCADPGQPSPSRIVAF